MPGVTVRKLYLDNQHKLGLTWAAGTAAADNRLVIDDARPTFALVGHLNFIHPNRIQVIGSAEYEFLLQLDSSATPMGLNTDLFSLDATLVIVANGLPVPPLLRDYCHTHSIPLMASSVESPHLMDVLRIYLQRALAVSTVMHGVFLDVFEIGVLIIGESGLGKSELALELISRGHGLVADDAVEIYRTAPELLEGRCPQVLRDFLEVRGLGILNIRSIFGATSVRPQKVLKLIINLVSADNQYMQNLDRLSIQTEKQMILDVAVRKITIPVAIGRNLAVLVESAVQNYILQMRGINSTREFLERHRLALKEEEDLNEADTD